MPVKRVCEGCARVQQVLDEAHKQAGKSKKMNFGLKISLMPQKLYSEMMKVKRSDPRFVEAEKEKRGAVAQRERREDRERARQNRIEMNAIEKGMVPDEVLDNPSSPPLLLDSEE